MSIHDIIILGIAVLGGGLPPLIWLWFFLREDKRNPEPKPLLIATFIGGMVAVPVALYFEKILISNTHIITALSSTGVALFLALTAIVIIEELVKYIAARWIALLNRNYNEPIDAMVYLITAALGFAALENTLFLIGSASEFALFDFGSLSTKHLNLVFINNNLRFIGATILHIVASGIFGFFIGLAFYKRNIVKIIYTIIGLSTAVILHAVFNFSIITYSDRPLMVFAFLWIFAIVLILLFEKIKRVAPD